MSADKESTLVCAPAAFFPVLHSFSQVPFSLRNMIGRSFATEDAQDQISAAVVDLFEVLELEIDANTEKVFRIHTPHYCTMPLKSDKKLAVGAIYIERQRRTRTSR